MTAEGRLRAANDPAADEDVILLDAQERAIGTASKLEAHVQGLKHLAISVIIRDKAGRLMLQRRALGKYHSAGLWTNTCCSHPRPGEAPLAAAHRRLREEMGFDCDLVPLFRTAYRAKVPGGLIEDEVVHAFGGVHDGAVVLNPDEAADWRWMSADEIIADMARRPDDYTVWFRHYVQSHLTQFAA
jgi:isopentenyl-diphosphate delta-isomerase